MEIVVRLHQREPVRADNNDAAEKLAHGVDDAGGVCDRAAGPQIEKMIHPQIGRRAIFHPRRVPRAFAQDRARVEAMQCKDKRQRCDVEANAKQRDRKPAAGDLAAALVTPHPPVRPEQAHEAVGNVAIADRLDPAARQRHAVGERSERGAALVPPHPIDFGRCQFAAVGHRFAPRTYAAAAILLRSMKWACQALRLYSHHKLMPSFCWNRRST